MLLRILDYVSDSDKRSTGQTETHSGHFRLPLGFGSALNLTHGDNNKSRR